MEDIANDILENPKPYKWALESGLGAFLGATYRTAKIYREEKLDIEANQLPYDAETTSLGMGAGAEVADSAREMIGKSEIFGYDDIAALTSGVYAGQKTADWKFSEDSE